MIWRPAITIVNARVLGEHGDADTLRFTTRILGVGERPRPGDVVVDAEGAHVVPGLINAHDHLELNHYGRLKFRDRYANVSEWIDDMRPRIATDAAILEGRSRPLSDRLFIGALKNLISGVTTVVHHNPFYRELRRGMPIRVLKHYGWAHSFALQRGSAGARGESGGDIQERFRGTASDTPFFVHLAEGIDAAAYDELAQLERIGCLKANTVAIHGVAVDADGWRRIARAGAAVVWCPASNLFLFGQTIDLRRAARLPVAARIVLGSDSRLTGSRDLLDELRIADESSTVARDQLVPMVTRHAADVIRQPQLGRLVAGAPADFVVLPPRAASVVDTLLSTSRRDLGLVVVGGRPMVGSEAFLRLFTTRGSQPRLLCVDGATRLADAQLVARIAACPIREPGVTTA
ncbi:MAG TPA: amidohydrolase family protein [Vicinamibacterales bacterium]|nr:amidohydrolase family protein [Vicinamibacterales bacterium]